MNDSRRKSRREAIIIKEGRNKGLKGKERLTSAHTRTHEKRGNYSRVGNSKSLRCSLRNSFTPHSLTQHEEKTR